MQLLLGIALGGALGALARHFVAGRIMFALGLPAFPYGTLTVNVIGSFLMGLIIIALAFRLQLTQPVQAFLTVGLLGGFTTFSAFSVEVALMIERHALAPALAYVLASVVLAVFALFAGMQMMRWWLT